MIAANEYCGSVFDGTHATPKPAKKGYKLLTSKNILNGSLNTEDAYYISEKDYAEINRRSQVHQWDILFSMIGTVGNVCLVTDSHINYAIKNMGVFSCRDEKKAKWLYYYLQSPYAQSIINHYMNGAVQKFLPLDFLRNFPVPEYKKSSERITNILWSIDTKIQANDEASATLESLAKTIYDYWFLQFDFPDENGRPYKSSGGKMVWNEELKREIPEGWKVSRLGEKCTCLLGGTPSREHPEYWNGRINWINSSEVNNFRISKCSETITEEGLKHTSTYLMPKNTVVIAITGATLGQVSILNIDACANQSVVGVLENEDMPTEYIYPCVLTSLKRLLLQQTGAAQPHVNKNDIMNLPVILPPQHLMGDYMIKVKVLYQSIMNNESENVRLSSLRDFLLPMLMNGQVTFKEEE